MKRKKVFFPAIAIGTLAVAGAVWFGSTQVKAASSNSDSLVEKIAQKFNLPKDQVQATFDESHAERQAARVSEQNARLDQAFKDGVITTEQKDKIIAKRTEMDTLRQQKRAEMQQWFKDNGIDESKLAPYMMGGREGKGHRGGIKNQE